MYTVSLISPTGNPIFIPEVSIKDLEYIKTMFTDKKMIYLEIPISQGGTRYLHIDGARIIGVDYCEIPSSDIAK